MRPGAPCSVLRPSIIRPGRSVSSEARPDPAGVDRRAMATLSSGHLFTDIAQGSIPAMLPFLIVKDHLSYASVSALVLAATISSSVIQPLFGHVSDRLSLAWLMPLGPRSAGSAWRWRVWRPPTR